MNQPQKGVRSGLDLATAFGSELKGPVLWQLWQLWLEEFVRRIWPSDSRMSACAIGRDMRQLVRVKLESQDGV